MEDNPVDIYIYSRPKETQVGYGGRTYAIYFIFNAFSQFLLSYTCAIMIWGHFLRKIWHVTFEIRSIWRPSAGARSARAGSNAMCKLDFIFIKIIFKSLLINCKLWQNLTATVLFLQLKIKSRIRGLIG